MKPCIFCSVPFKTQKVCRAHAVHNGPSDLRDRETSAGHCEYWLLSCVLSQGRDICGGGMTIGHAFYVSLLKYAAVPWVGKKEPWKSDRTTSSVRDSRLKSLKIVLQHKTQCYQCQLIAWITALSARHCTLYALLPANSLRKYTTLMDDITEKGMSQRVNTRPARLHSFLEASEERVWALISR